MIRRIRRTGTFVTAIVSVCAAAAACSSASSEGEASFDTVSARYSMFRAGNRYGGTTTDPYVDSVQPVLASRCAVCHSCTNGPCQLNMTSYEALSRGVSKTNPYNFGLRSKKSTRVSDNRSVDEWRERGFQGILPDEATSPRDSIFFKALELGKKNELLPDGSETAQFNTAVVRALAKSHVDGETTCPANGEDYTELTRKQPMGGMPWGLPRLENDRYGILEKWVLGGAAGPTARAEKLLSTPERSALTTADPAKVIADWETFLNEDSIESQLVGRYIYEHAFQANVHLLENPGEFYRIVRSRTAAPQPIDRIVTDLPMDPPGVERVYYRLEKIDRIIEGKSHILWQLGLADLAHFRDLFFGRRWLITKLPGYESTNPFEVFNGIPTEARARFMIENSRLIFQSFGRGPICLTQAATYAVNEYYWIWFLRPESDPSVYDPQLGLDSYDTFFDKGGIVTGLPFIGTKYDEPKYRVAFEKTLRKLKPEGLGIEDIWDGDGNNPNAWLTVHRHQASTDATTGRERPITGMPRAVWLMSYANFERMYYNAAAYYRYWGSLKHQNDTFNWQTFTRTEAEDLYVSLFADPKYRKQLRDRYTSTKGKLYHQLYKDYSEGRPARDSFASEDALDRAVYERMGPGVVVAEDRLNHWPNDRAPAVVADRITNIAEFEAGLRTLTARRAPFAKFVPNVVHLRVDGKHLYTLLANRGYKTDKIAFTESSARDSSDDRVAALPGFSGFEANLFIDLSFDEAASFIRSVANVQSVDDWRAVRAQYGIPRASNRFWPFVDWLHHWMEVNMPVEAALLELRSYDKDETPY